MHCIQGFLPRQWKLIQIHFIKTALFAVFIINIKLCFKYIISEPNAWTPLGKLISLNITPLQTRTCPLTILSVINNVCRMLHLVTYFPRKSCCIRSKKEQQTLYWSRTMAALVPMAMLEPQLPGQSILGKHQGKLFLSWSSLGSYQQKVWYSLVWHL